MGTKIKKAKGSPSHLEIAVIMRGTNPPTKLSVRLKLNPRHVNRTLVG